MKKVLILFLSTFIFTAGPYAIKVHAQEVTKPNNSLTLVTKILSAATESVQSITSKNTTDPSQSNETNKTESNSILLKVSQTINDIGNSVQNENKSTESVPSVPNKEAVPVLTGTAQTSGGQTTIPASVSGVSKTGKDGQVVQENQPTTSKVSTNIASAASNDSGQNGISDQSILSTKLNLSLVGNVSLDLLPTGTSSTNTELLGLGINGSALLGDVNVGLLSSRQDNNGLIFSSLADIDLKNLLGKTHLGVLETSQEISGDTVITNSGLLILNLEDTFLGNVHLGVIETSGITPYKAISDGLSNGNIDSSTPKDNHSSVEEVNQKESPEGKKISGSLPFDVMQNKGSPLSSELAETAVPAASLTNDFSKIRNKQEEKNPAAVGPNSVDPSKPDLPSVLFSVSSNFGSNGSGSGFGASGGGSGADALIDSVFQKNVELKNQIKLILQELSDEWIKAPPINPPQAFFFLSN